MRLRRIAVTLAGIAAWWLISCREIPAPENGVFALSPVRFPLPGLVAGDTMRDSLGMVAPLEIVAYGLDGEPLSPQPAASFIVLDTLAHTSGVLLIGEEPGTARVIGAVGALQTQPATVKITLSPDVLVAGDSVLHHKTYAIISGDTVIVSADLNVLVQHLGTPNTGVEAVIVRYQIDQAPTGNGSGPTVVLYSENAPSSRDTTDGTGRAARRARLRLAALTLAAEDTVRISATSSYRGQSIGSVQFTIIYIRQ